MIISMLLSKFKSLFLFFVAVFRRALCCFRRRRRDSGEIIPLSHIVVKEGGNDEAQWNDWEFKNRKPASVQEHIEYYRQQQSKLLKQQSQEDDEEDVPKQDLFQDMTPQITKQKKLLIDHSSQQKGYSLEAQGDAGFVSSQLENWEDESGWEKGSLDWDAQELLKEKKRQEREKRHWEQMQKRIEKVNRPNALGAKISS